MHCLMLIYYLVISLKRSRNLSPIFSFSLINHETSYVILDSTQLCRTLCLEKINWNAENMHVTCIMYIVRLFPLFSADVDFWEEIFDNHDKSFKNSAFRMSFKIQYSIYPPQAYFKVQYTGEDISSFSILKRVELSQFPSLFL